MDDVGGRNRDRFDATTSVEEYEQLLGLTPCEQAFFDRWIPLGSRVLDLGVGTGRTTPWLVDRASRYVGIDYAPAMVAAARRAHPGIDLRVGDARDLQGHEGGSYDAVVFSFNGIDYLGDDDRRAVLAEIRRVIVPGGVFVFSSHQPRAIIVPLPDTDAAAVRRVGAAALITLRRIRRLALRRSFITGEGWVLDPVKGGLVTHMASPASVAAELAANGWSLVDRANGDQPTRARRLRTPWWYYACTPR